MKELYVLDLLEYVFWGLFFCSVSGFCVCRALGVNVCNCVYQVPIARLIKEFMVVGLAGQGWGRV